MGANYIITEPTPSTTSYVRSGRGGAGNTFRAPSTPRTTTHILPTASKSTSSRFFSGIGGAGNVHAAHERPSPAALVDDELRRAARREQPGAAGHCGIGGAGNVYRRKASDASVDSDNTSVRSDMSIKEKLWARVSGSYSRD